MPTRSQIVTAITVVVVLVLWQKFGPQFGLA